MKRYTSFLLSGSQTVLRWRGLDGLPYFNVFRTFREALDHAQYLRIRGSTQVEVKRTGRRFRPMLHVVKES